MVEFVDSVKDSFTSGSSFCNFQNFCSPQNPVYNVPVGVAPSRRCSRPRARTPPPRPMLKAVVVVEDEQTAFPNSIVENAGVVNCCLLPIAVAVTANELTKALVHLECRAATQKAIAAEMFLFIILSVDGKSYYS